MYQWDAEGGRWDATHNPFSGVVPEDEALLVTASGDPAKPAPDDPAGRARALQYDIALNGWELGGGSVRIWRTDLLGDELRAPGLHPRADGERSGRCSRRSSTARRRTAGSRSASIAGPRCFGPDEHPRGHGVPEDPVRGGPDARGAVAAGPGAVRGARAAVRRRSAATGSADRARGLTHDARGGYTAIDARCPRPRTGRHRRARRRDGARRRRPETCERRRIRGRLRPEDRSRADPDRFGGAFDGGELVGIISPEFKIAIVRPDRRRQGIGRTLVELGLEMERRRGRPDLLMGALPDEPVAHAFLAACGFSYHSVVYDLDLPPDRAVAAPVWPAGHVGRSFDRNRDVGAWVALFNAAFADHPTPLQLDDSFIKQGLDDPDFVDADTIVVEELASGGLVGFCATDVHRHEGVLGTSAELWSIGVRPDRQGQGLGRQLVRAGVERVRSLGIVDVHLSVNARNAGALGLYEDEGFVRSRTRERYVAPRRARGGGRPLSVARTANATSDLPGLLAVIAARPRFAALLGAMAISFSGIFYRWAEVSPSTGTFYRCLFGLPFLAAVAYLERRKFGPLPRATVRLALIAGIFFAGDLTFWHHAIEYVGRRASRRSSATSRFSSSASSRGPSSGSGRLDRFWSRCRSSSSASC